MCPGLLMHSSSFKVNKITPDYISENSSLNLFSKIDDIFTFPEVSDIMECGPGLLVLGNFIAIGENSALGVAYWNGLKTFFFCFFFLKINFPNSEKRSRMGNHFQSQ